RDAGLKRVVKEEGPVTDMHIAIQGVGFDLVIGDEQRGPAATVVISRIDAHTAVGCTGAVESGAAHATEVLAANLRGRAAVGPGGAGAPQFVVEAGFLSHLDKAAAALAIGLVVEQRQPAIAGHEKVGPAIAVVVGHRAAMRVKERLIETDFFGDILEFPAAQVLKEAIGVATD